MPAIESHCGPSARDESTRLLISRLLSDVLQLLDRELALAKLEMKLHVSSLVPVSILLAAGGVFAMLGLLLLANAGALGIARAIGSLIGGYVVVGVVITLGAVLVIGLARARLARLSLAPTQALDEMRRDVRWISHEKERRSA